MLVLAVLCTLPLAGIGTALSLLLLALAVRAPRLGGRMFDTARAALPRKVLDFSFGKIWSGRCLRLFAALYDYASVLLSRRWMAWRHPRIFALWRVWLAVMALLILLPLPFGNALPGASLVLQGLGWIYKDGAALATCHRCGPMHQSGSHLRLSYRLRQRRRQRAMPGVHQSLGSLTSASATAAGLTHASAPQD